ncbi:MAG: glycoside hydrolase family 9 protein [Kineosporiaceae bacterium]
MRRAAYAKKCLETARALYTFAVTNRGIGESGGYYGSAYDEDELSWAATWLYLATGEMSYVNDITAKNPDGTYKGYMNKIVTTLGDTWQNIWVHSWDVVWGGTFALLAPAVTGKVDATLTSDLWYYFRWNAEFWTAGAVEHVGKNPGGGAIEASPSGYSVVAGWGSARYNTAAQLCAMVYAKHAATDPDAPAGHGDKLARWALSQMNYLLGDNPLHRSYEVGYTAKETDTYAQHPHHRDAHGSETNSMTNPPNHKHVLWGALVGGPGLKDEHRDETTDYVYNEVAVDYNAGFVGALAAEWLYFSPTQKVAAWTPPLEPDYRKWWSSARLEQENKQRTQVTIQVEQHFSTPPRKLDALKVRYYVDISELVAVGQTIKDVKAELYYDEHASLTLEKEHVTLSQPVRYGTTGNVYYVEVSWKGCPFWGKRQVQFGIISAQDANYQDNWDPTNDYSRPGLPGPKEDLAETGLITTYYDGVLVDGTEPDGTKPAHTVTPSPTKTTTTKSTTTTTKKSSCKAKSCTTKKSTKKSTCKAKSCTTKKSKTTCKAKTCTTRKTTKPTSTTTSPPVTGCSAGVSVVETWPGGFAAQVAVTGGRGGTPSWRVRWDAPGTTVTQVVGAGLTPQGSRAVIAPDGAPQALQPGQVTTFTVLGTAAGPIVPTPTCSG